MLPGTIQVHKGGGEFGCGFYTQTSSANAMRWALGRSKKNGAVLRIKIPGVDYQTLKVKALNQRQAYQLTARLRANNIADSYHRGVDVLKGPLNGERNILQYKFESDQSEKTLNAANTIRDIIR